MTAAIGEAAEYMRHLCRLAVLAQNLGEICSCWRPSGIPESIQEHTRCLCQHWMQINWC